MANVNLPPLTEDPILNAYLKEVSDAINSSSGLEGTATAQAGTSVIPFNSATLQLFTRTNGATPSDLNTNLTYDYVAGTLVDPNNPSDTSWDGWEFGFPSFTDGNTLWVIRVHIAEQADTEEVSAGAWSAPERLVEEGEPGFTTSLVRIFKRSVEQPTELPTESSEFTVASNSVRFNVAGSFTGTSDNNWYVNLSDVPSGDGVIWLSFVSISTNDSTIEIANTSWSTPVQFSGSQGPRGIYGTIGFNGPTSRIQNPETGLWVEGTTMATISFITDTTTDTETYNVTTSATGKITGAVASGNANISISALGSNTDTFTVIWTHTPTNQQVSQTFTAVRTALHEEGYLTASRYSFSFDTGQSLSDDSSIVLTWNNINLEGNIKFVDDQGVTLQDSASSTYTLTAATFGLKQAYTVTASQGDLSDAVTIIAVRQGDKGDTGDKGEDGGRGDKGTSITSISEGQVIPGQPTDIVITLDDGDSATLQLPPGLSGSGFIKSFTDAVFANPLALPLPSTASGTQTFSANLDDNNDPVVWESYDDLGTNVNPQGVTFNAQRLVTADDFTPGFRSRQDYTAAGTAGASQTLLQEKQYTMTSSGVSASLGTAGSPALPEITQIDCSAVVKTNATQVEIQNIAYSGTHSNVVNPGSNEIVTVALSDMFESGRLSGEQSSDVFARDQSFSLSDDRWDVRIGGSSTLNPSRNYSSWNDWLSQTDEPYYLWVDYDFGDEAGAALATGITTGTQVTVYTYGSGASMTFEVGNTGLVGSDYTYEIASIVSQTGTPSTSGVIRITATVPTELTSYTLDIDSGNTLKRKYLSEPSFDPTEYWGRFGTDTYNSLNGQLPDGETYVLEFTNPGDRFVEALYWNGRFILSRSNTASEFQQDVNVENLQWTTPNGDTFYWDRTVQFDTTSVNFYRPVRRAANQATAYPSSSTTDFWGSFGSSSQESDGGIIPTDDTYAITGGNSANYSSDVGIVWEGRRVLQPSRVGGSFTYEYYEDVPFSDGTWTHPDTGEVFSWDPSATRFTFVGTSSNRTSLYGIRLVAPATTISSAISGSFPIAGTGETDDEVGIAHLKRAVDNAFDVESQSVSTTIDDTTTIQEPSTTTTDYWGYWFSSQTSPSVSGSIPLGATYAAVGGNDDGIIIRWENRYVLESPTYNGNQSGSTASSPAESTDTVAFSAGTWTHPGTGEVFTWNTSNFFASSSSTELHAIRRVFPTRSLVINTGVANDILDGSLTVTANSGSLNPEVIFEVTDGVVASGSVHSMYTVTDYSDSPGNQVTMFSSSTLASSTSDLSTVLTKIISAVNSNTETPIDFMATNETANNRLILTAQANGQITGSWAVTVNNGGGDGNISFADAAVQQEGGIAPVISINMPFGNDITNRTIGVHTSAAGVAQELSGLIDALSDYSATSNADGVITVTDATSRPSDPITITVPTGGSPGYTAASFPITVTQEGKTDTVVITGTLDSYSITVDSGSPIAGNITSGSSAASIISQIRTALSNASLSGIAITGGSSDNIIRLDGNDGLDHTVDLTYTQGTNGDASAVTSLVSNAITKVYVAPGQLSGTASTITIGNLTTGDSTAAISIPPGVVFKDWLFGSGSAAVRSAMLDIGLNLIVLDVSGGTFRIASTTDANITWSITLTTGSGPVGNPSTSPIANTRINGQATTFTGTTGTWSGPFIGS